MVLVSVGVILMSCGTGCSMIAGTLSINECMNRSEVLVLVSLWLFFAVIGFTFVSFAFVVNIIAYLEGSLHALYQALCLVLFYLPAFVIFTLFIFHRIPYPIRVLGNRIWYLLFTKPMEPEQGPAMQRTSQPAARPPDLKQLRKEQILAKGPQTKPSFIVSCCFTM